MSVVRILELIVLISALVGGVALIWHKLGFAKLKKRTSHFLDDWGGDPARPDDGYEGRPSFPARMAAVEARTKALNHDMRDEIGGRLALVEQQLHAIDQKTAQLQRNGGSSLADAVQIIREAVTRLEARAEANAEGILDLSHRITDVNTKADALGERQETLRAADQAFARDLKDYIETQYKDALAGNEALRSALNEVLAIDAEIRDDQP